MYLCVYLHPHLALRYFLPSSSGKLTEITFRNLGLSKMLNAIKNFLYSMHQIAQLFNACVKITTKLTGFSLIQNLCNEAEDRRFSVFTTSQGGQIPCHSA